MIAALRGVALATAALVCLAAAPPPPNAYQWHLPPGMQPPPVPADNPMSAAKVELGRRLFYDADLSIDGTIACATCHEQHRGFAEGNPTHGGVKGARGRRNAMGLTNIGYLTPLTWARPDLTDLETQVLVPVFGEHPVEMGMTGQEAALKDRLAGDPCYRTMFADSFPETGGEISTTTIAKALSAFERTLLSFDSPYDREHRGDRHGDAAALTDAARRGEALFFSDRLHCAACHAGPNFTDGKFHALYRPGPDARDHGLREVTNDPADDGRFRTPGLRNAALTGPYLHDGTAPSLSDAIRGHFPGLTAQSELPRDRALPAGTIGESELTDLAAFVSALTDAQFIADNSFALPKTACGKPL